MNPETTEDVAECFPQLLPALIMKSISMDKISFDDEDLIHKLNSVILAKLLSKNRDILVYVFLMLRRILYILYYFVCICIFFLH